MYAISRLPDIKQPKTKRHAVKINQSINHVRNATEFLHINVYKVLNEWV